MDYARLVLWLPSPAMTSRLGATLVVVLALAACPQAAHPTYLRRDPVYADSAAARDALVKELLEYVANKDDRGIARLLGSPLGFGGVWFPDTVCRREFSGAGEIPESGIDELARCLSTLPLKPSARVHPYPDVAVFEYEPGIEIEAMFDPDDGGHLVWMGYAGRRDVKDALPTVTQASFVAVRNPGTPLALEPATQQAIADDLAAHGGGDKPFAWFKVCVDATGAVTGVHPRLTSSLVAEDAFAAWIKTWTFQPYMLGDQPSPVCSLVMITPDGESQGGVMPPPMPSDMAERIVVTPGALGRPLAGEFRAPVSPAPKKNEKKPGLIVTATAMYCIDDIGQVDEAVVMKSTGDRKLDEQVRTQLLALRYAPVVDAGTPVRVCTHVSFPYRRPEEDDDY